MTSAPSLSLPFQLRGNTYTMMVLKLLDPDDPAFLQHLETKIRQAPTFFRDAPVVLDLDAVEHDTLDFDGLRRRLRDHALHVVGIQGGTDQQQSAARACGLPVIPAARTPQPMTVARREPGPAAPAPEPVGATESQQPRAPKQPEPEVQRTTLIINEPVRSGRQIYAARGDLVVLAPVSPGAELLADGNIHVYNVLRGRALAGIGGDTQARIFALSMHAELVSVAGYYRLNDDIDSALLSKPVQVRLDGNFIRIDALG